LNPLIDARASQIDDPIAKLRFLRDTDRRVGQVETVLSRPKYWWLRNKKFWMAVVFLLMIPTVAFFRGPTPARPDGEVLPAAAPRSGKKFVEPTLDRVWLVDTKNGIETWSNGLRIETRFATTNRPRGYYAWNRNQQNSSLVDLPKKQPPGIVFHTTESTLEELEEQKTRRLTLLGENLLKFVQGEKAYHYVVDRFGRVWRIVAESDAANHAGKSVWADEKWAYIGLNDSFLAVSFETQTRTGDEAPIVSQAQLDAGRQLTRMLRARYAIPAANCVTHAQVSINPGNFLIGYHTDWAGNFPFEDLALPDNYELPLASLQLFGFNYDGTFFAATGARMWKGVVRAEDLLREEAKEKSLSVAQLRTQLRNQYRRLSALLPENQPADHDKTAGKPAASETETKNRSTAPEVKP
jgi:hypothetical protein